jgi:hypothetical protein
MLQKYKNRFFYATISIYKFHRNRHYFYIHSWKKYLIQYKYRFHEEFYTCLKTYRVCGYTGYLRPKILDAVT